MRELKVMCDYAADGLWLDGVSTTGEFLGIAPDLCGRIERWQVI